MPPPPEDDQSRKMQARLDALIAQLGDRASTAPRSPITEPELSGVIATLSAATGLFADHPLIAGAATTSSSEQPVGDLLLAAQLLKAALVEAQLS